MLELGGTWSRSFLVGGIAASLAVAAGTAIVYRTVSPAAGTAVLAAGSLILILGLLFAASRRLRQADDRLRLGARALDAPPRETATPAQRQTDRDPRPDAVPAGAQEPIRPKDAFLSALCHDLRSPLNACVMWLDVLALSPTPDKVTQAVEAIKRNLARQTRLVNDLSDAAKVSSGVLEVRPEPLDLVPLLRGHVDAWQLLAIGKQVTFEAGIELPTARVHGDPERLLQAFNHLIDNSLASTPSGGRIDLRLRGGPGVCIVEIEDTGTALSAEDVANMFMPLWRAPTSAKTRPGIGLGLAVAHHLVARHGGTLTARSNGSHALFTLTLPLLAGGEAQTHTL